MSDFILKLWPKNEITQSKSEAIKSHLKMAGLIGEEVNHWNGKSNRATKELKNYLDYDFEDSGQYSESLVIKISENDYGVRDGQDDYETFDRKNVVSIYEGDGSIIN
ncbi:hypothetical protein [Portibacter marinus]|uniref:hypothetical protein n=1 Tax=Portibacter marinus TaxID=2898660 RepID=UPI001F310617|nr:hypothetical protein [Portibacter marinus]